MRDREGMVLRIERASIHDGPGIRTVVFLKGCPLRCAWCSTPESQHAAAQAGYKANKCVGCGACLRACPRQALALKDGLIVKDQTRCGHCLACVDACAQDAMICYGRAMTVGELIKEIVKDEVFFFHSEGGVTLSGGEPLAQAAFAAALLEACKERQIGTALETSLFAPYGEIERVLPWLDHLYVDLKHFDAAAHQRLTGQSNALILENLRRIDASGFAGGIVVRVPLIPGLNDDLANLTATARFYLALTKKPPLELLPYHRIGVGTYDILGWDYALKDLPSYDRAAAEARLAELRQAVPGQPVGFAP